MFKFGEKVPKMAFLEVLSLVFRWNNEVCDEDRHESFLQSDTIILMGIIKHSQSFQNSEFTMLLQYLKKEVRVKVDFL